MKLRKDSLALIASGVVALMTTWNSNHLIALLAMATFAALALGSELRAEGWGGWSIAGFCAGCYVAAWIIFQIVGPILPTETDREVYLIPGNKPAPHSGCDGRLKNLPNGAIAFFLGSNGFWATNDKQNDILKLDGEVIISMKRKEIGLLFSAEMFDTDHKLVAKINNNKSILIPKNYSYNERPDRSTLALYDDQDKEMLYIEYLNKQNVLIRGVFTGRDRSTIFIKDDMILLPGPNLVAEGCLEDSPKGMRITTGHIRL
jgi:hypothetical protein